MQQLHTTAQASELLGIPASTIRAWLSRFPGVFHEGIHIVIQDGKKLWTETGLDMLRQRATENAAPFAADNDAVTTQNATETAAIDVTPASERATQHVANKDASSASATFNDALVEGFTDKLSLEIAGAIAEKLPGRVLHHINRMLHHNPTHQEQEILQHAIQQQLHLLPGTEKKYLALPQSK